MTNAGYCVSKQKNPFNVQKRPVDFKGIVQNVYRSGFYIAVTFKELSLSFGMISKKNIQSSERDYTTLLSHASVWGSIFFYMLWPEQNKTSQETMNVEVDLRTQLSYIKPDIKEICKDLK